MVSFYPNYYPYYRAYRPHADQQNSTSVKPSLEEKNSTQEPNSGSERVSNKEDRSSPGYSFGPIHFKNPFFYDLEEPIFEIFGIHLYLDDLIILGLLFFLYQEGVQDEMLFFALILLLLG